VRQRARSASDTPTTTVVICDRSVNSVKVTIYGIKNCDTMKKAFTWLEKNGVEYAFHDYKKAGVPPGKLSTWAKRTGWEKLANTRGPTWRKIPESARENLNEARALKLLEANSSAIKRPVVEAGSKLFVGFDEKEFSTLL
jgi:arsenate reductase